MTFEIFNPDALGTPSGWNHGLLAPAGSRILFVAGQTAPPGDLATQFERALTNTLVVVRAAGGTPEGIGRLTVFVTDMRAYRESRRPLGQIWRRHMGRHYPAMALVEVRSLVDPAAVVEIEATAIV